jgi:hypothetical protein
MRTNVKYICVPPTNTDPAKQRDVMELAQNGYEQALILMTKFGYQCYCVTSTWEKLTNDDSAR